MANLFKKIYTGTLAKYQGLGTSADTNSLYMVYDETTGVKSMYKGTQKVAGDFIIINGAETSITPEKGIIYYISEKGKVEAAEGQEAVAGHPFVGFWNGTQWVAMSDSAEISALDAHVTTLENATKIDGSATEGSIGEKVHTLIGDTSVTGSVMEQVATAKAAIEGSLKEGDSTTLAAINTELDSIDTSISGITSRLDVIQGEADVDGSINKAIADVIGDASTSGNTLGELEDRIEGLESVKLKVAKLNDEEVAALSDANVKEAYKLINGDNRTAIGEVVKIYKDSAVKGAKLTAQAIDASKAETSAAFDNATAGTDPQYLSICYMNGDGTFDIVSIDLTKFLTQSEFGDGLTVNNGKVTVKTAEDKYIGFSESADTDGNKKVVVKTVNISAAKFDDATGLVDAKDANDTIDNAVAIAVSALTGVKDGKYIAATANTATDRVGQDLEIDVQYGKVDGTISVDANTHVATTADGEVQNGIAKAEDVASVILANEKVVASALNDLNTRIGKNSGLTTTSKEVVGAINEVKENITTTIQGLDATVSATTTYSQITITEVDGKLTNVVLTNTIGKVSGETATNGYAEASEVRAYVDAQVGGKNVTAEGDDYISATAADNKVTVSATSKTITAVALAETSVQTVSEKDENQEVTVTTEGSTVTIGVNKATYDAAEGSSEKELKNGLVDGTLLKNYVADEIAKNAVYWEELN